MQAEPLRGVSPNGPSEARRLCGCGARVSWKSRDEPNVARTILADSIGDGSRFATARPGLGLSSGGLQGAPPPNWDYFGTGLAFSVVREQQHDDDPLIDGVGPTGAWDPGTLPDPTDPGGACLFGGSEGGLSTQSWFSSWTGATSLPQFGGRFKNCNTCYGMARRTLEPWDVEGHELYIGPAQMQWFWLCVTKSPADSEETNVHFGLRVTLGDDEMYLGEGLFVPGTGTRPFAIRARQTSYLQAIRVRIWRQEGEEDSSTDLKVAAWGRLGEVSKYRDPPWHTDI